ncbi:MAG TPA: hypothetical protein VLA78_02110 [Paracoccaceae bacterium]|nr:hypothetical protein [Paracoccaceae bacterium]
MTFRAEHELHRRRFGRNLGVAVTLAAFIALVFALTVVKVTRGDPMQAFDHVVRPEMTPVPEAGQ